MLFEHCLQALVFRQAGVVLAMQPRFYITAIMQPLPFYGFVAADLLPHLSVGSVTI